MLFRSGFECEKISIEKIKHFVSKEAFNIDGFGKKIVENFWNLKIIRFPQDVFKCLLISLAFSCPICLIPNE